MIYELVTLLKPENTPTKEAVLKVNTIVKLHGGELVKYEDDGVVRLNHRLKGYEKSHRLYYVLSLPSTGAQRVWAELNTEENCLRQLLIVADKKLQAKYEEVDKC